MIKKIITPLMVFGLLLSTTLWPLAVSAAAASISLTASKSTVASGSTVIIGVYMNGGGTGVNAVQADLSYPASKLQYIGFSANGSAFEIGASSGGGDGLATIARGSVSAISGSGLVGTVTFKALVGAGSAAVGVAGSSSLVSDGNAVAYSGSGVSVNFGAVPAGAGALAKATSPAPPKDTAAPIISDVKVKDLTPFSVTISWTTSEPSDSAIDYGLDVTYGLSVSASPPVTAHSVTLNSAFLTPQTLLHYRVKSTDGAGNVGTGVDKAVQLPGVAVTIVVRGADGKPQAGASVTLDNDTGITDASGRVTLHSGLGNKKIVTTYGGVTIQKPITVEKTVKPLPPYQLDLSKKPMNVWMLTSIGLAVVVLSLLAIDAVLFGSRLLARLAGIHLIPHGFHRRLGHAVTASATFAQAQAQESAAASAAPQASAAAPLLKPLTQPANAPDPLSDPEPDSAPDADPAPYPTPTPALDLAPAQASAPAAASTDVSQSPEPIKIALAPLPAIQQITVDDALPEDSPVAPPVTIPDAPPTAPPAVSSAAIATRLKKPKTSKPKPHKSKTAPKLPPS